MRSIKELGADLVAAFAHTVERTVKGLFHHHAFDAAAAMTFYFFLSLIPLLAFVGFVLGRVAVAGGLDAFVGPLYAVAPANVSALVRDELERMGDASGLAPFSLIGFVYLTSSGTHNAMDLLEVAVGAPPRGWWRQRAIAILWNVASVLIVAALAWAFIAFTHRPEVIAVARDARTAFEYVLRFSVGRAEKIIFSAVALTISVSALALFFRVAVSHPRGVTRRVWPGAVVAVLLGVLVSWGFAAYVATLAKYAVYYGSLAAVAVLLMWLYLSSLALLVGAEINAQLEGLRAHLGAPHVRPSARPRS